MRSPDSHPESRLTDAEVAQLADAIPGAIFAVHPGLDEQLETDPDAYLTALALCVRATEVADATLRSAVSAARTAGASWESVGAVLNISRQAAQQRFAGKDGDPTRPEQRKLMPLTAFNEMEALSDAGRHGWHSVGFGTFFHLVEKSDEQWEHARVLVAAGERRAGLEHEGWQHIGRMWFPWAYYARATGLPAEPEPS